MGYGSTGFNLQSPTAEISAQASAALLACTLATP
jgi:hypothetical protein